MRRSARASPWVAFSARIRAIRWSSAASRSLRVSVLVVSLYIMELLQFCRTEVRTGLIHRRSAVLSLSGGVAGQPLQIRDRAVDQLLIARILGLTRGAEQAQQIDRFFGGFGPIPGRRGEQMLLQRLLLLPHGSLIGTHV